jgi:hypothetical protein
MIDKIFITKKNWKKIIDTYNKKSIIKETNINYWLDRFAKRTDGFCYPKIKIIALNFKQILKTSQEQNRTFIEEVCLTITHEEIHLWMDFEVSVETSRQYDNIYKKYEKLGYKM